MSGWIKLHRKITLHWIWNDPEMLRAWVCILLQVNHAPAKIIIKGFPMECARGQSLNSLETWGKLFGGWSKNRVSRFFAHLKNDAMIELECDNKTTRLTLCNYESYQGERDADGTQTDTQTRRRRTTNKNDKNEENEKKVEFTPPTEEEVDSYIVENGYPVSAVKWHSHYTANGWVVGKDKTPMKDWKAAVRTWIPRDWRRPKPLEKPTERIIIPLPKFGTFEETGVF